MRPFIATVLLELGLVSGAVYWADPGQRWHSREAIPPRELRQNEAWLWPSEPERGTNIKYWAATPRVDVMLFGSSRAEYYYQEMFSPKVHFFNAWIGGAHIEDYVEYWQALKESEKTPPRLILMVDPWLLNKRWWPRFATWLSCRGYVDSFLGRRHVETLGERVEDLLASAQELLSFTVFARSLYSVWRLLHKSGGPNGSIVPSGMVGAGQAAFLRDGTHPSFEAAPSGERAAAAAMRRRLGHPGEPPFCDPYEFNPDAARLLKSLLSDMAAHGTRVMVIAPPAHPLAFSKFPKGLGGSAELRDFEDFLAGLRGLLLDVCDLERPRAGVCFQDEYLDAFHIDKNCSQRVISKCLGPRPGWRDLLRP